MKIALAAAGTAGHIEPALALAKYLKSEEPGISCEFLGTISALDSSLLQGSGFERRPVTKAPFPRKLSLSLFAWPFKFAKSLSELNVYLNGCDVLVGFGGYVCAPAYVIARFKGIPVVIHEANVKPGMANELGRRLGASLTTAFEGTKNFSPRWGKATLVGMPTRESIRELSKLDQGTRNEIRAKKADEWGFDSSRPIVLVFGGSQGSRKINSVIAELMPETSRFGIQIVHAVGKANELPARSKNYLPLHYISDMAHSMISSDMAITRGGAVTCAELGILRTYGVIVPLALGNGEQEFNARELSQFGGAAVIPEKEFNSSYLSGHLLTFIKNAKEYSSRESSPAFITDAHVRLGEYVLALLRKSEH